MIPCMLFHLATLVLIPGLVVGVRDVSGLPPGPYCANRYPAGRCCYGRQDECSAPILTTMCYCDDFCDRAREEDCCPDYWSHCRGMVETTTPGIEELNRCFYQDKYYDDQQGFMDNCNKCTCRPKRGCKEKSCFECETNRCLMDPDVMRRVNQEQNLMQEATWTTRNYSMWWGRTLKDGLILRLGTISPPNTTYAVRKVYDVNKLPGEFDSRSRWPRDVGGVHDQGWCGASWAISTVDVASDRYAIMSKGAEDVDLSAQHLLACNNRRQRGCDGGHLDRAWSFIRRFGLVDEECYPWTGRKDVCRLPKKRTDLSAAACRPRPNSYKYQLYKVGPAYRLGNETDIMQEILTSGPVQATMRVYQDFFYYKDGVYTHSRAAEAHGYGYHSVRILGWGEQKYFNREPMKYWLVANSWGYDWGENGLFKIRRGTNECEIESYVLGVWAKTT